MTQTNNKEKMRKEFDKKFTCEVVDMNKKFIERRMDDEVPVKEVWSWFSNKLKESYEDGYADALKDGTKTCDEMVEEAKKEERQEIIEKIKKGLSVYKMKNGWQLNLILDHLKKLKK